MGHDHIRSVLMVTFLSLFSTCLLSCSTPHGSEMEITRFSGAYTLTHSERVVDVTESIRGSEVGKKVRKVGSSSSLAPVGHQAQSLTSLSEKERTSTAKEFEMRGEESSSSLIENGKKTFTTSGSATKADGETSTRTQGRSPTDQEHLICSSHAQTGHWRSDHGRRRQEFTATYSDSSISGRSSSAVCQKLSLFSLLNVTRWRVKEEKGGRKGDVMQEHQQQALIHEQEILFQDHHHPSQPIFFVYPFLPAAHSRRGKAIEKNYTIAYYYEPIFHSSSGNSDTGWFLEFDPRIIGGFDSYGHDTSLYFHRENDPIIVNNREKFSKGRQGETGSVREANASSFDELCKALLREFG